LWKHREGGLPAGRSSEGGTRKSGLPGSKRRGQAEKVAAYGRKPEREAQALRGTFTIKGGGGESTAAVHGTLALGRERTRMTGRPARALGSKKRLIGRKTSSDQQVSGDAPKTGAGGAGWIKGSQKRVRPTAS